MSSSPKPRVEVEEYFAVNALDDSDYSSDDSEYPVKRYASAVENAELIARNLKAENLKQLQNQLKKDESEQVRYLSLDNATMAIEIIELKHKIELLEKITKPFESFEEILKTFEKNSLIYETLIDEVNSRDYKELMNSEIQKITPTPPPTLDIPELPHIVNILNYTYSAKKSVEEKSREKFHDAIFWKATLSKHQMFRAVELIFGVVTFILFIYNYFKL